MSFSTPTFSPSLPSSLSLPSFPLASFPSTAPEAGTPIADRMDSLVLGKRKFEDFTKKGSQDDEYVGVEYDSRELIDSGCSDSDCSDNEEGSVPLIDDDPSRAEWIIVLDTCFPNENLSKDYETTNNASETEESDYNSDDYDADEEDFMSLEEIVGELVLILMDMKEDVEKLIDG
ncbi:hypothetical protein F53441_4215 [Fusarium austroafricanum]|uniref:Uncharacterized protein n=1 Tax=Fusarium austroafricanum TaxID=2364996 RepID=A0A8H4NVQ1_9HYPO|nr:hypothetical protein F53441_4215 [Fusarium austroafricanum]